METVGDPGFKISQLYNIYTHMGNIYIYTHMGNIVTFFKLSRQRVKIGLHLEYNCHSFDFEHGYSEMAMSRVKPGLRGYST